MKIDLNLLPVFIAVAEEHSFSKAAARLGVTRSAVSQGIRRLEDAFGTMLVMRTTRSVNLTEAGERLHKSLSLPVAGIEAAFDDMASDDMPRGLLRIAVTSIAEEFLSGPLIASFAAANPAVTLDIVVTDEEFDIVAAGYDAGVRLGEVIEKDMIAIPLTGKQREMVVASSSYLAANGTPIHPCELMHHRCIGWRPAPDVAPYRWPFEENGKAFDLAIEPQITTNDLRLMLRLALAGGGITLATQETFRPYIEGGQLVSLLDDFLPHFPGFYLYFPQRRNIAPKLRALIDHVREWRQQSA
ncbi:LysR family transcriptional regulator [Enterobacter cloacae]|uniref:LysR family transcriptional regulator n=1 Tax=Enterobacter cloacae TaxID=550 RepID=UPI001BDF6BC3|nr:LysR family transcriptional regulator [Enterobacter cloacae]MBT1834014.1 LysR family transcriptional regulator [Enterobacter cloacae]HBL4998839.1 LysR family transcriptional regulator [Enterobacter cloacae]